MGCQCGALTHLLCRLSACTDAKRRTAFAELAVLTDRFLADFAILRLEVPPACFGREGGDYWRTLWTRVVLRVVRFKSG